MSRPSVGVVFSLAVLASAIPTSLSAQMTLPRDLEIELAESALPEHLRDGATVYVYDPTAGFVVVREGRNGFHTLVSRVDPAVFKAGWEYAAHPVDVILPIAFDAAGAAPAGPMQPFLDVGRLMAGGAGPSELKREMKRRFDSGVYRPAARAGVSYMLSPLIRSYPDPLSSDERVTITIPHRMFYAPNVTNADIGGDPRASPQPFIIQPGEHGYMSQHAGPEEVEAIRASYSSLLIRLCRLDPLLCQGGR